MGTQTRKQSRWTFWRFVRWSMLLSAMVFVLPVLVWFIANRFDESPTQEALDYSAEPPRQVADADNAWLLLAGIGAAPEENPLVLGRRRVDMVVARSRKVPMPEPDAAEVALFVDAVPKVGPDTEIDGVGELCPSRDVDCIAWAHQYTGMLERLRAANSLRLTRWQTALTMHDWQALYPPLLDGPVQDPSVATLHLNLLALELSQTLPFMPARGVVIESTEPTTLEKLAQTVVFWRRVQASPQDLISTLVAARQIEDAQRIADNWLSMRNESSGPREEAALDQILAPPGGPTEWREALRHEFRGFAPALRDASLGPWDAFRQCLDGTAEQGCLKTIAMNAAYAPQATQNLHARHYRIIENLLEVDPQRIEVAHKEAAPVFEETFVAFDDPGRLVGQLAHNFAGRILAQIAVPAFDWGRRLHDQEALRRMILLKREAKEQGIAPEGMDAFLSKQPENLRNPFTGEPFDWNVETSEIHFVPSASNYWKREALSVVY